MTVEYSPLKSNNGFQSPGFSVDSSGNVTMDGNLLVDGDATVNGVLFVDNIQFADQETGRIFNIIEDDDSVLTLSSTITNSHLKNLGILEKLEVDGDVYIGIASTNFLSIDNGTLVINSSEVGSLDNIEIGQNTPADAAFVVATASSQPTDLNHLTRKDYVDTRVSAFAIAFGA